MRAQGDPPLPDSHSASSRNRREDTIPVVEEQVRVGTRQVEIERRRVVKTVRAHETTIDPRLAADDVRVERVELDPPRFVDEPPAVRQEGDTTIIPVLEERLVVEKRLVVREELRITRSRREYRDPRRVVLRSEHVAVERLPPGASDIAPEKSSSSAKSQEKVMERMLVGVFDSKQQMEAALRDLRDCAIPDDRVHIHSGTAEQTLGATDFAKGDGGGTGFFDRLFGRAEGDVNRHARLYAEAVRRGGCVVVVDGIDDARVAEAVQILERDGAYDIDERAAKWRESGWNDNENNETLATGGALATGTPADTLREGGIGSTQEAETKIPVVEEQLNVGKREVQRGGVRVFTRTSERQVEENVTLREERARVTRRPVERPATEAELGNAFEEKAVEIRATAEEPVVAKTARVVEEVDVGKEASERTETVRDTVRKRDVEVEDLPGSRTPRPADANRAGRR
jgi:uncharacterized protein (TIGR02271 family)